MVTIKFLNHKKLNSINLKKIIEFKKTFWKFSLISQKNFLKKNSLPNDIHLLIFKNKELVGYSFLNFRKIYLKNKITTAVMVDNILVKKKLRGKLGVKLIKIINKKIKKLKKIGVLICNKRLITFYKFFKWKTLDKRKILTSPKTTLNIMVFNCNHKIKISKIYFST